MKNVKTMAHRCQIKIISKNNFCTAHHSLFKEGLARPA